MNDDDAPQGVVLSRRHAITLLGLAGAGVLTPPRWPPASCVPNRPKDRSSTTNAAALRHPRRQTGRSAATDVERLATEERRLRAARRTRSSISGTATPTASTPTTRSCAATNRPTPPAPRSSPPSIPAGTPAAPCTSTSRSAAAATFASQLYFDDAITDRVHARAVYANAARAACATTATGSTATAAIN